MFGSAVLSMDLGPKERAILSLYVWIEAERQGTLPITVLQIATHDAWMPINREFEQLRATSAALNFILLQRHHDREVRAMAFRAASSDG